MVAEAGGVSLLIVTGRRRWRSWSGQCCTPSRNNRHWQVRDGELGAAADRGRDQSEHEVGDVLLLQRWGGN